MLLFCPAPAPMVIADLPYEPFNAFEPKAMFSPSPYMFCPALTPKAMLLLPMAVDPAFSPT